MTELLDQVERSFEVTLKYHKGAHEQRISAVYVMATGTISPQARERIWNRCRQRNYGENVFFPDGETLDNLDQRTISEQDSQVRGRLVGLLAEAVYNVKPITILQESLNSDGRPQFRRCRMLALEDALRSPLPDDIIRSSLLSGSWMISGNLVHPEFAR